MKAPAVSPRGSTRLQAAAGAVAARIALRHLDAAMKAGRRLKYATGAEALHDFRVALRRLRSILRAYRPWLKAAPKKLRRCLRDTARDTGAGRDAEVCLAWLARQKGCTVSRRNGWDKLQAHLERVRDEAYARLRTGVLADFTKAAPRLRRILEDIRRGNRGAREKGNYAEVTAGRLREYAANLAADLSRIHGTADITTLHDARIQAKRLRYLLEPLGAKIPGARAAVKSLKTFQDETGNLYDGFVCRRLLAQAAGARGADPTLLGNAATEAPAGVPPGLIALARRMESDIGKRFEAVRRCYLDKRALRFLRLAGTIARQLEVIGGR